MKTLNAQENHVDATLADIRHRMNKELITSQIDQFIDVIGTEEFVTFINDIAALPTYSERRKTMAERANLDTLGEYGVTLPDGLRLTTREFEVPEDGHAAKTPLVQVRPGTDPRMGACASIGYIICASYGN